MHYISTKTSFQTWLRWLQNICKVLLDAQQKTSTTRAAAPRLPHTFTPHYSAGCSQRQTDTLCWYPSVFCACLYFCVFLFVCFHVSFLSASKPWHYFACLCAREKGAKEGGKKRKRCVRVCLLIFFVCQWVFMQTVILSRMWAAIQRLGRHLLMN